MGLEDLLQHKDETVRKIAKEVLASDEWRKFKRRYSPSLINRLSNFIRNKTVEPDKEFYKNISKDVGWVAEYTSSKEACEALVNYANTEQDKKLVKIVAGNVGWVAKHTKSKEACTALVNYANTETDRGLVWIIAEGVRGAAGCSSSKEACERYIEVMGTVNLDAYTIDGNVVYGLVMHVAEGVACSISSKELCTALVNYANTETDKGLVKIIAENAIEVARYDRSKKECIALINYANTEQDKKLVKIIAKNIEKVAEGINSKEACEMYIEVIGTVNLNVYKINRKVDYELVKIIAEGVGNVAIGTISKELCTALVNYANNETDKELVKIVAGNVGWVAKHTKSKEACEMYIAVMNTFNLNAYKADGNVDYGLVMHVANGVGNVAIGTRSKELCTALVNYANTETDKGLVKIVAESVGKVAEETKSKEACTALINYANTETDKELVKIVAENVGWVAGWTSSKEACEMYIEVMGTVNLNAYKINGNVDYKLVKIIAGNVGDVAKKTSSKETIMSFLDILQSEKVYGRIVAKVLSGESLGALEDLHIHSHNIFDSKTAYAISRSAFEKEKSISKIQAICNGIRYVGRNEQLKGFYDAGRRISDSKYSLLNKIGIMPETVFSIFSSSLQGIFNEDIPETYSALCRELGRKENKHAKKAKALKQELESQKGGQRELTQRRYDDALSKVQASSDNLAIELINEMIIGAYVKLSQEIVGKRYAKDSGDYFGANIGDSTKIGNMVNAMAMYHRIQANKPHLKQLIIDAMQGNPNRQLLKAKENRQFIKRMKKRRINMQPWLEGYSLRINLHSTQDKLIKNEERMLTDASSCRDDILKNLAGLGGCYEGNTAIDDLHEYFSQLKIASMDDIRAEKDGLIARKKQLIGLKDSIVDESCRGHYKTALFHIGNLVRFQAEYEGMQLDAELKGKVRVYLERDPLAILQMGNYFTDSCLATSKENAYSCVANAVDANDAVLYAEYNGEIVGRKLLKLSDDGKIMQHRSYTTNYNLDMDRLFNIFVKRLAARMKTEVGDDDAKYTPTLHARKWYADGIRGREHHNLRMAS